MGSVGKESICNAGDHLRCRKPSFNPWVWKIPYRRTWQPTLVFLPWKFCNRGGWWANPGGHKSWTWLSNQNHHHGEIARWEPWIITLMSAVLIHQPEGECHQMQGHYGKGRICSHTVGALPEKELSGVPPQGFLQMQPSQQIEVEGNLRTREGCFRRITVDFSR